MKTKIEYIKVGDYYIPNLTLPKPRRTGNIGKYGRLRLNYIKNYKRGLYTELMINGTLSKHLADIENTANERISLIVKKLAEAENVNEALKSCNQLAWVQSMNNIKNRAEEIAYNEIIYVQEDSKI